MKNGKRLLRVHKELLKANGLDSNDYLYIKDTPDCIEFVNIYNRRVLVYHRK